MTERRTNRLTSGAAASGTPAFITLKNGEQVPTDIHAYCAWLNSKEHRRGQWIVVKDGENTDGSPIRKVDWREEVASNDWLRERNLVPQVGKAA